MSILSGTELAQLLFSPEMWLRAPSGPGKLNKSPAERAVGRCAINVPSFHWRPIVVGPRARTTSAGTSNEFASIPNTLAVPMASVDPFDVEL
jgi:hypothetical protein